ncbi:MAG: site-specific integrase [Pyrinomonadaceae bacterium]
MAGKERIEEENASEPKERKRSPVRYWRVMNGSLYARFQYTDANGKKKEKIRPISDKRTARRVVEEMRRELTDRGPESLENDQITFGEFAPLYKDARLIPAVFANKIKVAGRKSKVTGVYDALVEYFGVRKLRSIKPRDLELFKTHRLNTVTRRGKPRNIATVNRELSLLRAMLNYAYQNDFIVQNPFSKIKGVIATSAEVERDRILNLQEEARMLAVCVGRRSHLRAVLICALDTAMRSGEMLKMKWKEVDLETYVIEIPQENSKTEKSRVVGITSRLRDELEGMWEDSSKDPSHLVFGGIDSVKTSWNTACRLAEVSDFRLHDCRHTGTTRMIAAGIPHMEVMKITGHMQIKTFLRYLNLKSDSIVSAAKQLGDFNQTKTGQITDDNGHTIVGEYRFGDVEVVTLFLGLDEQYKTSTRLLFGTKVVGGALDGQSKTYFSFEAATSGHARFCSTVLQQDSLGVLDAEIIE